MNEERTAHKGAYLVGRRNRRKVPKTRSNNFCNLSILNQLTHLNIYMLSDSSIYQGEKRRG